MNMPMIPALFRARAREVLKKNLSTALMVSFLAALPGLLTQVYRQIAGKDLLELVRYHLLTLAEMYQSSAADDALLQALNKALTEVSAAITPALQLAGVLSLAAMLITPALTLGLTVHLLKLVRGQRGEVMDVTSRLGCFLKAILQNIVVAVKMLLWAVPGLLGSTAAMYFYVMGGGRSDFLLLLYFACFFASMGLMIRAALHYSLCAIILADDPTTGVFASIQRSIQLMRTHKADFVRIYITFLVLGMVASWISSFLGVMIPVLGTASSLALQLLLGLYTNTTIVVFYLHLTGELKLVLRADSFPGMQMPGQFGPGSDDDNDDDSDDDLLN